jgi:hypothetical protein
MARKYAEFSGRIPDKMMKNVPGNASRIDKNVILIMDAPEAMAGLSTIAYGLANGRLMIRRPRGKIVLRIVRRSVHDGSYDTFRRKMTSAAKAHALAAVAAGCGDPPAPALYFAGADPGQNLFVIAHELPIGKPLLSPSSSNNAVTFARVERAIVSCWMSGIAFGHGFSVSDISFDASTGRTVITRFDTAYKMPVSKMTFLGPYIDAMDFDALAAAVNDAAAVDVLRRMRSRLSAPEISTARYEVASALRCRLPKNSSHVTRNKNTSSSFQE